jgi:hypothetical protein
MQGETYLHLCGREIKLRLTFFLRKPVHVLLVVALKLTLVALGKRLLNSFFSQYILPSREDLHHVKVTIGNKPIAKEYL